MKKKSKRATESRTASFKRSAAQLHARINGRLTRAYDRYFPLRDTDHNLFGSLWSPLRLDLLKAPLTRYRE